MEGDALAPTPVLLLGLPEEDSCAWLFKLTTQEANSIVRLDVYWTDVESRPVFHNIQHRRCKAVQIMFLKHEWVGSL